MIYNESLYKALKGKSSIGGPFDLTFDNKGIEFRDEYLLKAVEGKNILHFGFLDHVELLDEKIESKTWLHERLVEVSNKCYGIDINEEGINYLKTKYNYKNLYALDIIEDMIPKELLEVKFDYILIPEVIEHIGNPVFFLKAIKEKLGKNIDSFIITVPSAFSIDNFANIFSSIESINTDHRFSFTPYTISKILVDANYTPNYLGHFEYEKNNIIKRNNDFSKRVTKKMFSKNIVTNIKKSIKLRIKRKLRSKYKCFKNTLIIEGKL